MNLILQTRTFKLDKKRFLSADLFRASSVWDYLPSASSSQPAATRQLQPKPASQPAKPASQPTLHPGIEASGFQASMAPNSYIGASNRFPQGATARHRAPQVAKPSGTHSTWGAAKHAINPSNIDDMANFPANHVGGSFGSLISRPPDKAGQGEAPPFLQA